jgi:hypothetical protein
MTTKVKFLVFALTSILIIASLVIWSLEHSRAKKERDYEIHQKLKIAAIQAHMLYYGMTKLEVLRSLGEPNRIDPPPSDVKDEKEMWIYGHDWVAMTFDDKVMMFSDGVDFSSTPDADEIRKEGE